MVKQTMKWVVLPMMSFIGFGVSSFSVGHYFTNWFIPFEASVSAVANSAWGANPLKTMADSAGMKLVRHKITNKRELYEKIDVQAVKLGVRKCALRAISHIESGDNKNRISEDGALGVMQVMPFNVKTAAEREDLMDNDEFGIQRGGEIYKEALDARNGDEDEAAMMYHCGSQCFGAHPKIGPKSKAYVVKFKAAKAIECKATEDE